MTAASFILINLFINVELMNKNKLVGALRVLVIGRAKVELE